MLGRMTAEADAADAERAADVLSLAKSALRSAFLNLGVARAISRACAPPAAPKQAPPGLLTIKKRSTRGSHSGWIAEGSIQPLGTCPHLAHQLREDRAL